MGIKEFWRSTRGYFFGLVLLVACCGLTYVRKDQADRGDREAWQTERAAYIKRFPQVRAEERASCTREYEAQLTGLRELGVERDKREAEQTKAMADLHDLTAYMLRFVGDRARIADKNAAQQLKEARVAAAAAVDAKEKTEQVNQKVEVAVAKADEAASAVKSVDQKLETAVRPTAAVPSHVWGK